jgi:alpha-N-arabinofuranosidase
VQQLYSTNKGTDVLRILHDGIQVTGNGGFYATAAWDENSKEIILKIVNRNPESTTINIRLNSHKKLPPAASRFTLQSDDLMASNSLEKPENIVPVKDVVKLAGKTFPVTLKPYSLTVLRIKQ